MSSRQFTFDIRQSFQPGLLLSIYRAFPKFPGYWKFLELLAWLLPRSVSLVQADISLGDRDFRVPLDLRNPYQIDIYAKNKKELCEPALFCRILKPGDFYLDVGANCGWHCRLLSEVVGDSGLIVAIEPGRHSFAYLTKLTCSNILPLCFAATSVNGTIVAESLSLLRQWGHYSALSDTQISYGAGEGLVIGRSIDHLLREFRRLPDVIKIDVEGAELQVLRGPATH
jgi:FkbM family methyltransferase